MYIKWCIGSVHFKYHYKYVSSKVQSAISVLNVFSMHTQTHTRTHTVGLNVLVQLSQTYRLNT